MFLGLLPKPKSSVLLSSLVVAAVMVMLWMGGLAPSRTALMQCKWESPPPVRAPCEVTFDIHEVESHAIHSVDPLQQHLTTVLGPYERPAKEAFVIVTPSFRREPLLPTFLDRYATGKIPSCAGIVIQWADVKSSPSIKLIESLSKYPVPVSIVRPADDSLNERFRVPENYIPDQVLGANSELSIMSNNTAIFSLDDDILLSVEDVEAGFQAWREFGGAERKRMVGFFEREIRPDGAYEYHEMSTYSIILTKGAFLHRDWLSAYWSPDLADLRRYVHEGRNCEDILMSFLFAHHTRLSPVFFQAPFNDIGTNPSNGGISMAGQHQAKRNRCVAKFTEHFGTDTPIPTTIQLRRRVT